MADIHPHHLYSFSAKLGVTEGAILPLYMLGLCPGISFKYRDVKHEVLVLY